MKVTTHFSVILLLAVVICQGGLFAAEKSVSRWEKTIAAFEDWDAKNSFAEGGVLFVGSSSIRMWRTREFFPGLPVINRGFGGSQVSDVNEFAHRIVLPYKPGIIVLYAGDNDIAAGESPEGVFGDYKAFVKIVHDKLPRVPIIYISIKPSASRWKLWPQMDRANSLIMDYSVNDARLFYVDGATPFLGENGEPDAKFYLADRLHLSGAGYKIWTELLSPINIIKEFDTAGKSLSLILIKEGMGPHNLPESKVNSINNEGKSGGGASDSVSEEVQWVASKSSKVFHRGGCRFVKTMSEKNKVVFSIRNSAIASGRRACKTCNP